MQTLNSGQWKWLFLKVILFVFIVTVALYNRSKWLGRGFVCKLKMVLQQRTHARMHARTRARAHIHTRAHTHTLKHTHRQTDRYTHTHTHTHTDTRAQNKRHQTDRETDRDKHKDVYLKTILQANSGAGLPGAPQGRRNTRPLPVYPSRRSSRFVSCRVSGVCMARLQCGGCMEYLRRALHRHCAPRWSCLSDFLHCAGPPPPRSNGRSTFTLPLPTPPPPLHSSPFHPSVPLVPPTCVHHRIE